MDFPSPVTAQPPDRFKATNVFWNSLPKIGLTPAAVLRQARLPATLYDGEKNIVTTAQFFALWRAIGELNPDPAAGLKLGSQLDMESYHPLGIAALHARDYRDAPSRMARYKRLCCPEEMQIVEGKDECVLETGWVYAAEDAPPVLTDAIFASLVELGRRGTGMPIHPKRIELRRTAELSRAHETHFQCPVKYRGRRNRLVFRPADLDRPFITHNADLLEMLGPQLDKQLAGLTAKARTGDRVKWILKRLLAGNRPDILTVARELGVSARTLQRKITEEGTSFRQLLLEARRELVRQYLTQPSIEINEAAYLLGYDDPNSFYRAFRSWEGVTPDSWRSAHRSAAAQRN
jgi:AraC-like DNA-binding protein